VPTVFERGNSELLALVKSPTLQNLQAYFDVRTAEWCEPVKSMECFDVGVFYDLSAAFRGSSAFDLLNVASQMATDSMCDKKYLRYVDLLADLAESSETTEMPPNLAHHWKAIIDRATEVGPKSASLVLLKTHYRDAG
jgi:hypothetical protein